MKLSDYLVKLIKEYGCTDIFGYQGGMIAHFADSLYRDGSINVHTLMNEQGCAFAACGYAQTSGNIGWVFTSSGPGATNLITGICNAYYDSVPMIFITGQVNTNEAKGRLKVRQKAFQETDILSMVKGVSKATIYVQDPKKIKFYIQKAVFRALEGRKGPVVVDLPMNIQRAEIDEADLEEFQPKNVKCCDISDKSIISTIKDMILNASRPVFLFGNGIKSVGLQERAKEVVRKSGLPAISSMIACDILGADNPNYYGFLGAYGHRAANFIIAKSDLIIAIGTRMDVRQIGARKESFAPNAKLLRFDIDNYELENRIKTDEVQINCNIEQALRCINEANITKDFSKWVTICKNINEKLTNIDFNDANNIVANISKHVDDNVIITTDVGQNQVWVAQSFFVRQKQKILFSGGHGAMGYSLPAAIGAYYASHNRVICFCGDGGFQMNIQELQVIAEYKLPITMIVLNNSSLGMIRHFQEMYFDGRYTQTINHNGYSVPNFQKIAKAYEIASVTYKEFVNLNMKIEDDLPLLVNVELDDITYIKPKLEFGKPNQDQEPLIPRELYNELMAL